MAANDQILSRLVRTMKSMFRIGDVNIKDSSGVVQFRNSTDAAFVDSASLKVRIHGSNATDSITLAAPAGLAGTVTLTFPSDDGASGQFLQTDGSGNMTWVDTTSNASLVQSEAFTEVTGSPLTIFTPPANAFITKIAIEISAAAAGGSPTLIVGTGGTPNLYMATTDSDVKTTGIYEIDLYDDVTGSPAAVILTIVVSGQTFSGTVFVHYTTPS